MAANAVCFPASTADGQLLEADADSLTASL
jgi:hypothetical protein